MHDHCDASGARPVGPRQAVHQDVGPCVQGRADKGEKGLQEAVHRGIGAVDALRVDKGADVEPKVGDGGVPLMVQGQVWVRGKGGKGGGGGGLWRVGKLGKIFLDESNLGDSENVNSTFLKELWPSIFCRFV